jgi:hypothetical protein
MTKQKSEKYHGHALCDLRQAAKSTHLGLTFDQALRLRLALDSALLALNRHNRATSAGKNALVRLSIKQGRGERPHVAVMTSR